MPGEECDKQNKEQGFEICRPTHFPPQATGEIDDGCMEDIDAIRKVPNLPEPVQERKRESCEIDDSRHRERAEEVHEIATRHKHEDGGK